MKAKLSEDSNYATIDSTCDPIGLLQIIKSIAHNNESQRNPTVSLILAEKRLMNMIQGDGQSNDSYRLKFENQANVIQNMGGQLYRQSTLNIVSQEIFTKDYNQLTEKQSRVEAQEAATELWKATLFITNSNPTKFDQLKKELHNDYISGDIKSYPKTFNDAFHRLNQHKPYGNYTVEPTFPTAFAQQKYNNNGSDSDGDDLQQPPRFMADYICAVCGETGHLASTKYCHLTRSLKNDPSLRAKLKAAAVSDNNSTSDDDSSTSFIKKKKKPSKKGSKDKSKDKKSTTKSNKRIKEDKQLIQQVLTTLNQQESSSDSGSNANSDSDSDPYINFQMFTYDNHDSSSLSSNGSNKPDFDSTDQPSLNSRSARNPRSASTKQPDTWTLVSKKAKRRKHTKTSTIHSGDTITMKNNHTGVERNFTSHKTTNRGLSSY